MGGSRVALFGHDTCIRVSRLLNMRKSAKFFAPVLADDMSSVGTANIVSFAMPKIYDSNGKTPKYLSQN
jgi:hypothetical protein